MPVVPTYEDRGIRLDPGLNFRDNTHATPEMFGSQVGEGLMKAGQGLTSLGGAVAEVEDLDATNAAKDKSSNFISQVNERTYGENGYLSTSGRASVEGRKGFLADITRMAKEGAKGLSPLAERRYWDAVYVVIGDVTKEANRHEMAQRSVWRATADNNRTAVLSESAIAKPEGSEGVPLMVAAAVAQNDQAARDQGMPDQKRVEGNAQVAADITVARLGKVAESDPKGALTKLELVKGILPKEVYDRLQLSFGKAAGDEEARQGALAFAAGTRKQLAAAGGGFEPDVGTGPTAERTALLDRAKVADAAAVLKLDGPFAINLSAMMEDAPAGAGLGIAFRKGSDDTEGRSVELTYNGDRLDKAPDEVQAWARRNAGRYGLTMPVGGAVGVVTAVSDAVAARALRPSLAAIDKHLQSIDDPRRREIAKQAIATSLDLESQQERERLRQAKATLWQRVEAGTPPDALPYTLRQAVGDQAMTVARNYIGKKQAGPIVTDDMLLADMRLFSAERPEDFALVDLNDYRDRLEDSDLKALAETQAAIGRDGRKARDQGAELTDAFDMAKARLEDAGAILPGEENSGQRRQLLAEVQNAVYTGLADFRAKNPGIRPAPADVRKMIDKFLLPYYVPLPDPRRERPTAAKLSDISPDLRRSITRQLATEYGRKPTDGEVAREYQAFMQAQGA